MYRIDLKQLCLRVGEEWKIKKPPRFFFNSSEALILFTVEFLPCICDDGAFYFPLGGKAP